ncbi:MAG TPA: PadR family transcriptional regulator [Vicinamibacterales bacterium]|nr:PadR family transcriptional regulator [Vicinamibacterales bacterium]
MPFRPSDSALPLTPISFEILLALTDGDRHGYAILQHVESRTGGVLPMRTGTLYRALARLEEAGLIDLVDAPQKPPGVASDDERRRYYRITARGRQVARDEARRLAGQVAAARSRHLLSGSDEP